MKIAKTEKIILWTFGLCMLSALALLYVAELAKTRVLFEQIATREHIYGFRESLDYSTNQLRLYVTTGESTYRDGYVQGSGTLRIQERFLTELEEYLTPEEYSIAQAAHKYANTLNELEMQILVVMDKDGSEEAKALMFSEAYFERKLAIADSINSLQDSLVGRFSEAERISELIFAVTFALMFILLIASMIAIAMYVIGVNIKLRDIINEVRGLENEAVLGYVSMRAGKQLKGKYQAILDEVNRLLDTVEDRFTYGVPLVYAIIEDGIVKECNPYTKNVFGMVPGRSVFDFIPDNKHLILAMNGCLPDEPILASNKENRRYSLRILQMGAKARRTYIIRGLAAEEGYLNNRLQTLNGILDALPPLMICDITTRKLLYCNTAYDALFELNGDTSILEDELFSASQKDGRDPVRLNSENSRLMLESAGRECEFRYVTRSGKAIDCLVTGSKTVYEGYMAFIKMFRVLSVEEAQSGGIEGIDMSQGIARFNGNSVRYMQVLSKFAESLEHGMPDLSSGELPAFAHMLKGTAGNLGVTAIYEAAMELERVLKEKGAAGAAGPYAYLEKLRPEIAAKIKAAAGSASAETPPKATGDNNEYAEILAELAEALSLGDPEAAEEAALRLSAKTWALADDQKIAEVLKLVEGYEFETALEIIQGLSADIRTAGQ